MLEKESKYFAAALSQHDEPVLDLSAITGVPLSGLRDFFDILYDTSVTKDEGIFSKRLVDFLAVAGYLQADALLQRAEHWAVRQIPSPGQKVGRCTQGSAYNSHCNTWQSL